MTAQVKYQVLADNAHEVTTDHADVISHGVFANICIDGGKTLSHSA